MRYVMIYCEYPYAGWIFESIQNDTLFGCVYPTLGGNFKFLRTKSRE